MTPRACSRAHFSAARTSSTQVGTPRSGASSRVRATRSTIPRNDSRPARMRRRPPRWPRCTAPGRHPRPARRDGPAGPRGRRPRRAGRSPTCWRPTSPAPAARRAAARARPARGRSAAACRAGSPGRWWSRRRTHHRVHDRLRVHDDVDVGVRDVEQQVRLDQLQPLVDQRGRVDRHDRAHVPRGVGQGVLDGDVGQVLGGPAAERAAAGGQDQAGDLAPGAPAQALGQRRVLGVHRHQLARRRRGGHERAPGDQRLLVRQRHRAPGGQRGQRRAAARSSR